MTGIKEPVLNICVWFLSLVIPGTIVMHLIVDGDPHGIALLMVAIISGLLGLRLSILPWKVAVGDCIICTAFLEDYSGERGIVVNKLPNGSYEVSLESGGIITVPCRFDLRHKFFPLLRR